MRMHAHKQLVLHTTIVGLPAHITVWFVCLPEQFQAIILRDFVFSDLTYQKINETINRIFTAAAPHRTSTCFPLTYGLSPIDNDVYLIFSIAHINPIFVNTI